MTDKIMYKIEELKIWKGVDPNYPVWCSRGFVGSKQNMEELAEYLCSNEPSIILRVVEYN